MNASSQPENPQKDPKEQPTSSLEEKRKIEKDKINFLRQQAKILQKKKAEESTTSVFEDKVIDSKRSTPQWKNENPFQKEEDESVCEENNLDTSFILNQENSPDREKISNMKINESKEPGKVLDIILAETKKIKSDPPHPQKLQSNKIESQNFENKALKGLSLKQKPDTLSKTKEKNVIAGSLGPSQVENFPIKRTESVSTTISDRLRTIEDLLFKVIEKQMSLEKRFDAIEKNQQDQAFNLEDISRNLGG